MFCWHKWSKWEKSIDKNVKYNDGSLAYRIIIQQKVCSKCNLIKTKEEKIFF